MNIDDFKGLTPTEQKDFVNTRLKNGESLDEIGQSIGTSRKTIYNAMKENKYTFDRKTRQYIYNPNTSKPIPKNAISKTNTNNDIIEIFTNEDIKNNLLNLAMNYEKIQRLLDRYENNTFNNESLINESLRLKLLNEKDKNIRTTIKIHKEILDDFDKFCSENKDYLKQDLVSSALYEFLEKRGFYQ